MKARSVTPSRVNGAPARLADADEVVHTGEADQCNPDQVAVTFAAPLKAGDTVSVVSGLKLGAKDDQRTVGGASVTTPAPTPDRTRPTISIIMIAGRDPGVAEVTISEPDGAVLETADITTTKRGTGATADVVAQSVRRGFRHDHIRSATRGWRSHHDRKRCR